MVPPLEDYRTFSAIRFRQNILSAVEGQAVQDPRISEYSMMKKYSWTYDELLATPFHVVLYLRFIESSIQSNERLKELKNSEREKM